MVYHTKELIFTVLPNEIIKIVPNPDNDGTYRLETVEENLAVLHQAIAGKKRATLFDFPNAYIKKDVLKKYANADIQSVASALLAKSSAAKFVGNLFLSLRKRLNSNRKRPIKIFTNKEVATKWLLEELANVK